MGPITIQEAHYHEALVIQVRLEVNITITTSFGGREVAGTDVQECGGNHLRGKAKYIS